MPNRPLRPNVIGEPIADLTALKNLNTAGFQNQVISNVLGLGFYLWFPPASLPPGDDLTIVDSNVSGSFINVYPYLPHGRATTVERDAMPLGALIIIFNTDNNRLEFYDTATSTWYPIGRNLDQVNTWFFSKAGNDLSNGQAIDKSFLTIAPALSLANNVAGSNAGIYCFDTQTYTEQVAINNVNNATIFFNADSATINSNTNVPAFDIQTPASVNVRQILGSGATSDLILTDNPFTSESIMVNADLIIGNASFNGVVHTQNDLVLNVNNLVNANVSIGLGAKVHGDIPVVQGSSVIGAGEYIGLFGNSEYGNKVRLYRVSNASGASIPAFTVVQQIGRNAALKIYFIGRLVQADPLPFAVLLTTLNANQEGYALVLGDLANVTFTGPAALRGAPLFADLTTGSVGTLTSTPGPMPVGQFNRDSPTSPSASVEFNFYTRPNTTAYDLHSIRSAMPFRNISGASIPAGTMVKATQNSSNYNFVSGLPVNSLNNFPWGMLETSLANGAFGFPVRVGTVTIPIVDIGAIQGTNLYLTAAGLLTIQIPADATLSVPVGFVAATAIATNITLCFIDLEVAHKLPIDLASIPVTALTTTSQPALIPVLFPLLTTAALGGTTQDFAVVGALTTDTILATINSTSIAITTVAASIPSNGTVRLTIGSAVLALNIQVIIFRIPT